MIESWARTQRVALPDRITVEHLLASAAIPFVFPAVKLNIEGHMEHFGDGSIRQLAPISPAIHLGANRVMVIGSSQSDKDHTAAVEVQNAYPSLAQIAGHAMASIFLDSLSIDIERLSRVNKTLGLLPPEMSTRTTLKPIELLVISPLNELMKLQHGTRKICRAPCALCCLPWEPPRPVALPWPVTCCLKRTTPAS